MDSGSEDGGGSPTSILKKHKSGKKELATCIVVHKRPFKLRFAQQLDKGRSYVSPIKPLGLESTVASKFYAKDYNYDNVSEQDVERAYENLKRMFSTGPREKHNQPVLDSHNYGWHQGVSFQTTPKDDRRFHHHIRDCHLVKSQILILSTDKKTGMQSKK